MPTNISNHKIFVIQPPIVPESLRKYASILRDLRLQSLRESPEAFTERHDDVFARPETYWHRFIEHHNGLIHIAFGLPESEALRLAGAEPTVRTDSIMALGLPLGMAVNTGPVSQDQFVSLPASQVPLNRPDEQEQRFHAGMLFHIAEMRGSGRGKLFEHLMLDRDEWLLNKLQSTGSDPPPVAKFRGNVKPGRRQKDLLSFYARAGWYIAGAQTWSANLLAEGGPAAVQAAECRGDDMDEVSVVVEKIFTTAHLEWQISRNRHILGRTDAPL